MRQVQQALVPARLGVAQDQRRDAVRRAQHRQHVGRHRRIVVLRNDQQVELRVAQQAADAGTHAMHDAAAMPLLQPQRHRGRPAAGRDHQRRPVLFDQRQRARRHAPHHAGPAGGGKAEQRAAAQQPGNMRHPVPGQRNAAERHAQALGNANRLRRGAGARVVKHPDPLGGRGPVVRLVGLAVAHADGRPGIGRLREKRRRR